MDHGRPSSLTEDVQSKIVAALQRGCYLETAVQYAGISKTALHNYLKRGRQVLNDIAEAHENEQPDISTHDANCANFVTAVDRAMAEAEVRDVSAIDAAAQAGVWQAAAWKLERKHHARWGKKLAVTDQAGGNFFEGMAKAWAQALESEADDTGTLIEGELDMPALGQVNGSGG